jgi:hypothetical protein
MARAKMAPKESSGMVLQLAGMVLEIDTDSFTIPESALMGTALKRLTSDAAAVLGVEMKPNPDMFVACAAFVVARRQDPTLTYDGWFNRFTMRELADAVRTATPPRSDSPEA